MTTTPINPATHEPYTGSNVQTLRATGYASGEFATFKQWCALGRVVAEGQRAAAKIVRPRGKGDDGRTKFRKMAVFAREQTVPLEPRENAAPKRSRKRGDAVRTYLSTFERAELRANGMPAPRWIDRDGRGRVVAQG